MATDSLVGVARALPGSLKQTHTGCSDSVRVGGHSLNTPLSAASASVFASAHEVKDGGLDRFDIDRGVSSAEYLALRSHVPAPVDAYPPQIKSHKVSDSSAIIAGTATNSKVII
jgi:hypothetical protein